MTINPIRTWGSFVVLAVTVLVAHETSGGASAATAKAQATTNPRAAAAAATQPSTAPASTLASAPLSAHGATEDSADWAQTMNRLGALLAGKDLAALQKMMQPSPVIRPFSSEALQTHERLLGATTGSKLLGVHAYEKPPAGLATDLANDFNDAGEEVPQSVREGMLPTDVDSARRANDTAGQWLVQVLQPQKDEVMGVIVLWPKALGRALAGAPTRATFVLVKGEKVNGAYVLRQITFGDPLDTPQ